MGHEIEFKLELAPGGAAQLEQQPWFGSAERRSQHQLSVYYDTPDRRLRKHGYVLRVRSAGGRFIQTVKSLESGAGLFHRGEWEYQVDGPGPDVERLASTPLAAIEIDRLEPVLESEIERTACRFHEHNADIELDVDNGRMTAAGREVPVCEIEIELLRGQPERAVALARRIAREVPVKLGVMSKAERGFALANGNLGKVSKAEPVPVRAGMTVAEGFAAIVAACIRHLRLNEPLVIDKRVPEALHQVRVAVRRLRAALSLFRTAISDKQFQPLREELRWFTGTLGDARNLDVFLERDLPEAERRDLRRRRKAAYDQVIDTMDSTRFRQLMLNLVAWITVGEWRAHANAQRPLRPYARRRLDRLWKKIASAKKLSSMREMERHHLRIRVKKLRYSLEFVEALVTRNLQRKKAFTKVMEELQESLGQLNDIVVARSLALTDIWPIDPLLANQDERRLLQEAERSMRRLRKIGSYWRSKSD